MIIPTDLNDLQARAEKLCAMVEKNNALILKLVPEHRSEYAQFLIEQTESDNRIIGKITEKIEHMLRNKDLKGSIFTEV